MAVPWRFLNVPMKNSFGRAKLPTCFSLMRRLFCDAAILPSSIRNESESVLVVDKFFPGATMLRRLDLRSHLFSNTAASTCEHGPESAVLQDTTEATEARPADDASYLKNQVAEKIATKMKLIDLPSPIFTFETKHVPIQYPSVSFPLTDGKVVVIDRTGSTALFDADTGLAVAMPKLKKCKKHPVSLFVPSALGGKLYIFERFLEQEVSLCELSDQFEAMVVCHSPDLSAYCELLPPPPFLNDSRYRHQRIKITAYTVVGSDICISTNHAGTYLLDTCSNMWHKLGDWTLPFNGKVHYVPELKLWFGMSAEDRLLAIADLSAMDSKPQLADIECPVECYPYEGWVRAQDAQLIKLGSGRFCIAKFFVHKSRFDDVDDMDDESTEIGGLFESKMLVLTGVEVMPSVCEGSASGSEKVKLRFRQHKSVGGLFQYCPISVY